MVYLERQMEKHETAIAAAESFKMIAPAWEDVVEWVAQAWGELSAETIANGFKVDLQEGVETDDSQHQVDQIVARLEQLDLLDKRVGEVTEEQDFVDRVVNGIEYADV
ncbi:unnamed protein product [Phytophthora fragariaefolia]|uniref:Unnamed protein product n=1 Tax=Phytophthora fragariaefolia TaxID=1490495 RepID=A0A9W7D967_9STRA|nr:unnamed protein product [Phytophthora fragariaefolia]